MPSLHTDFIVDSKRIYLCYYDPESNNLKEINEESIKLILLPYQETIKRFYLISDEFESNTLIRITTKFDGPQKYSYKIKTLCGKINPEYLDFDSADSNCTVLYDNVEKQWDNSLPVDIWIQSLNKNETIAKLDITISLEKSIQT